MTIRAIVLNDTRRNTGHIGCSIVMENLFSLCRRNDIDVIASVRNEHPLHTKQFCDALDKTQLVIVNGEGTMHGDKRPAKQLLEAAAFARDQGSYVWLINSVWQNNRELNDYLEIFNVIAVRESLSLHNIRAHAPDAVVMPDLCLTPPEPGRRPLLQARTNELVFTDSVDPKISHSLRIAARRWKAKYFRMGNRINLKRIVRTPKKVWKSRYRWFAPDLAEENIAGASMVVTGRFHAMILCLKYGVPFSVIESNTHKVEGVLQDAGLRDVPLFRQRNCITQASIDDAVREISTTWSPEVEGLAKQYARAAGVRIEKRFAEFRKGVYRTG